MENNTIKKIKTHIIPCSYCGAELERVMRIATAVCFDCKAKRKTAYTRAYKRFGETYEARTAQTPQMKKLPIGKPLVAIKKKRVVVDPKKMSPEEWEARNQKFREIEKQQREKRELIERQVRWENFLTDCEIKKREAQKKREKQREIDKAEQEALAEFQKQREAL